MIFLFISLLFSSLNFGSALTPSKGKSELYLGMSAYQTKKFFNENSKSVDLGNQGKFRKIDLSYFALYGLRERLSVVAQGTLIQKLSYENRTQSNQTMTSGDHFFGVRYLLDKSFDSATSLQALLSFPLYSKQSNPVAGNNQNDLDLRLNQDWYNLNIIDFIALEIAYRLRFSSPADQARLDLTMGKNYSKLLIMGHFSAIKSFRNQTSSTSQSNPNANRDFDLYKLGVSSAYWYQKDSAIQVIYMRDVYGRLTGHGHSLALSLWERF